MTKQENTVSEPDSVEQEQQPEQAPTLLDSLDMLIDVADKVADMANQQATEKRGVNIASLSFADGQQVIDTIRRLDGIASVAAAAATDLAYQRRLLKLS